MRAAERVDDANRQAVPSTRQRTISYSIHKADIRISRLECRHVSGPVVQRTLAAVSC